MAGAMPIDAVASSFANLGDEVAEAGSELAKLADVIAKMTAPVTKTFESLGSMSSDMAKVADSLSGGFSKRLATTAETMGKVFGAMSQKVTGMVGAVGSAFSSISRMATGLVGTFARVIGGLTRINNALLSGVAGMVKTIGSLPGKILPAINKLFSDAAGPLGGALIGAITAALNPLRSLGDFMAPFMHALNPALMEQLSLAFSDLYAVIGRALTPILGALTPIVRTFADAMVPVSAALKPVFDNLAKAMIQIAGVYIPLFAGSLITLAPIFERLTATVNQVVSKLGGALFHAVDAVVPVFVAVGDAVGKFINSMAPIAAQMNQMVLRMVQGVAPFITKLIPLIESLGESFARLQMTFFTAVFDLAEALSPLVDMVIPPLISALTIMTDVITWSFEKIRKAGGWIGSKVAMVRDEAVNTGMDVANAFLKFIGQGPAFDVQRGLDDLGGGNGQPGPGQNLQNLMLPKIDRGASMGAATRAASFMGISELGRNLQSAAFGAGQTPEMKTAENTATLIEKMNQLIGQGAKQLQGQQAFKGNQLAPGVR